MISVIMWTSFCCTSWKVAIGCGAGAIYPRAVAGVHVEHLSRDGRHLPAFPDTVRSFELRGAAVARVDVEQALAVLRNEGVQVDQGADAIREAVRDTGDHEAAVRVTTQHEVGQFPPLNQVDHVLDVRVQIHSRG